MARTHIRPPRFFPTLLSHSEPTRRHQRERITRVLTLGVVTRDSAHWAPPAGHAPKRYPGRYCLIRRLSERLFTNTRTVFIQHKPIIFIVVVYHHQKRCHPVGRDGVYVRTFTGGDPRLSSVLSSDEACGVSHGYKCDARYTTSIILSVFSENKQPPLRETESTNRERDAKENQEGLGRRKKRCCYILNIMVSYAPSKPTISGASSPRASCHFFFPKGCAEEGAATRTTSFRGPRSVASTAKPPAFKKVPFHCFAVDRRKLGPRITSQVSGVRMGGGLINSGGGRHWVGGVRYCINEPSGGRKMDDANRTK
ncbi:hypothetical protein KQX54_011263 [Cotesia glomerata]|uniref:Uncharacterized protein n=1 Tax=Cotesia glomerata TaxID=32391 RepID=A0AAV7J4R1_COTGL|nr:hypothetical protein KQX54_011263 [Cotesia glomerata]